MTIKTAGDLRAFLAETLEGIRRGEVDIEEASAISKVSAQINQSLSVEVNAAIQMQKLGKDHPSAGSMLIASDKPKLGSEEIWCDQCDAMVGRRDIPDCKSKFCSVKDK